MDVLEIGFRVGIAVLIPVAGQVILPSADIRGFDLIQLHLTENRCDLQVDQKSLAGDRGGFETLLHVLLIELNEILKQHAEAAGGLTQKIMFPLQCFFLGGEATLFLVYHLARPVFDADLGHPFVGAGIFSY